VPEPARLTAPFSGYPLTVNSQDVRKLQLWIKSDGNGEAVLPTRKGESVEYVTVLNIPGSALTVMTILLVNGIGFRVDVDTSSSVTTFRLLYLNSD
jgi:hypothetical protein